MAMTRDELQGRLDRLAADMPGLVKEYPDPGDFNSAFAGRADDITDEAGAADHEWVNAEIDKLLQGHGLWNSGEESMPPDE